MIETRAKKNTIKKRKLFYDAFIFKIWNISTGTEVYMYIKKIILFYLISFFFFLVMK